MRSLLDKIDPFRSEPRNDLLSEREENEAYCFAQVGKNYAVYFPAGGEVQLLLPEGQGPWKVAWLDIPSGEWDNPETMDETDPAVLNRAGDHQVALVSRENP